MIQTVQQFLNRIINTLDVILSVVGLIVGIIILLLSFSGTINQHSIGITVFLSSALYLMFKSQLREKNAGQHPLSYRQKIFLNLLFFLVIILADILWYNQLYLRPMGYFILISVLAGLISVEIILLGKDDSVVPVLLKIFLLAIMVRAGIYYNFPSIMGYDAYFHTNLANIISATGSVPPFELSDKYINYPILHIFVAISRTLLAVDIRTAIFLSIGFACIFSLVFIYIFVERFAGPRTGLLAVLIISLSNEIINGGITNFTAGSLVFCYFVMILYLFLHARKGSRVINGIIFFIMAMIILTHQLTAFVVLLCLSLVSVSLFLFAFTKKTDGRSSISLLYMFFFGISMISYWTITVAYRQESFFEYVLQPLFRVMQTGGEYGSDVLIVGYAYARPLTETLVLQIDYLIIPFFALGGIYYWLAKNDEIRFSVALSAGTLFFIVYTIPLLGIRNFLTDRWMPFLLVFLGILSAAYIITYVDLLRFPSVKLLAIFLLIGFFTFFMITTPGINKDNPLVAKDKTIRNQHTLNEIRGISTLQSIRDGKIFVDPSFSNAFSLYGGLSSGEYRKKIPVLVFSGDTIGDQQDSLVVLRKSTMAEPVMFSASELYGIAYTAPVPGEIFLQMENSRRQSLIFTNGNIIGYHSP